MAIDLQGAANGPKIHLRQLDVFTRKFTVASIKNTGEKTGKDL